MSAVAKTPEIPSPFPQIMQIEENQKYKYVIKEVRSEYEKTYSTYSQKVKELGELIIAWTVRYTSLKERKIEPMPAKDALEQEFNEGINTYIAFRDIRECTQALIKKYNTAIAYCRAPSLDEETLSVLQKMGVDLKPFQKSYDKIFINNANLLNEEKTKLEMFLEANTPKIADLRRSLELLGEVVETPEEQSTIAWLGNAAYSVTVGAANKLAKQTPIVNKAVEAALKIGRAHV